jgi:hypothetical protein
MAERRMFSKMIIDSDAFLSMPMSTQALYFHLAMRADDDGFINAPRKIARMVGAAEDDMKILIGKRYILAFASGVIVIKHWRIHNYIQSDRYKPTLYQEEKSALVIKDNKSYTEASRLPAPANEPESVDNPDDIQNGYKMDTQVRLGKDRLELGKEKESTGADAPAPSSKKPAKHKQNPKKNTAADLSAEAEGRFQIFWSAYPKKVAMPTAQKAFRKLNPDATLMEIILKAIKNQKISIQWTTDNGQYIPNPSTWLNNRRWEDKMPEVSNGQSGDQLPGTAGKDKPGDRFSHLSNQI